MKQKITHEQILSSTCVRHARLKSIILERFRGFILSMQRTLKVVRVLLALVLCLFINANTASAVQPRHFAANEKLPTEQLKNLKTLDLQLPEGGKILGNHLTTWDTLDMFSVEVEPKRLIYVLSIDYPNGMNSMHGYAKKAKLTRY